MDVYVLPAMAGILAHNLRLLIILLRDRKRLKTDLRRMEDDLRRVLDDLAGLCAAAVEVDRRLVRSDTRLLALLDTVSEMKTAPPPPRGQPPARKADIEPPQAYDNAIQKIRQGCGVDELVKHCGLTRDEAVLLISLHGGKF